MKTLFIAGVAALCLAGTAHAVTYTQDGNLADFTAGVSNYATFSNFHDGDAPSNPYTPTTATLNHDYRVFNWSGDPVQGLPAGNWILATFSTPQDAIRIFPNIDHLDEIYDGYQYSIWGNDGSTWTELFDAISASGSGPFTLNNFFGAGPSRVNNVLTPGLYHDAPGGQVGYIADFSFAGAYKQFALGTSTLAGPSNPEQEFSAVAAAGTPEPAAWSVMILGFGAIGAAMRRRRDLASA
jgi:hypothetical protein